MTGPVAAYLVAGGRYHDIDFARCELLKLLGEREEIRTRVAEDYRDVEAIAAAAAGSRCTAPTRCSSSPRRACARRAATTR